MKYNKICRQKLAIKTDVVYRSQNNKKKSCYLQFKMSHDHLKFKMSHDQLQFKMSHDKITIQNVT